MDKTARRPPPINAVRVFEAAARLGSFTRAAAELGMTQAAVSYQIKVLEDRLGFLVFRREPRQVVLTSTGLRLSRAASEAFSILRGAFADVQDASEHLLNITALPTFSSNWLAPRLGGFQVAHPDIAVRVDTSPRMLDLTREDVDVGIRMGEGPWPGLTAHFLMSHKIAPLVPARADAARGPIVKPEDLLKFRLVGPITWWRQWFDLAGAADAALPATTVLELQTQQMEVAAALSSDDAAVIVSPTFFAPEIAARTLLRPFKTSLPDRDIWLVHDERRKNSRKIAAFVRWILAEMEPDAEAEPSNPPPQGLSTAP